MFILNDIIGAELNGDAETSAYAMCWVDMGFSQKVYRREIVDSEMRPFSDQMALLSISIWARDIYIYQRTCFVVMRLIFH